ncbi:hypothetical protein C8F04DRAFT_1220171 [Mycena alexandri]|uniref:NAD(P)-binding protein n=1 Tax=Mycena alexandri TaxID=1745969 RepID=A0AAD6T429_9AGAR|nr:hypothetical protein C8F04DRAFT_1220171 [Mycena alexandri]
MSLLCLSGSDVARVATKFSPEDLQMLMAHVFYTLTRNNTENPTSYTPPRITFPTQNHTALFMPARIVATPQTQMLHGTSIKVVCVPTSPADQRGLPASTLVLNEETGAVKAILNASNLTALRNAAGSLLSCTLVGPHQPVNIVVFGAGAQIASHLDLFLRAFPSIQACTIVNRSVNERVSNLAALLRSRFPAVQISSLAHDASTASTDSDSDAAAKVKDALLSAHLIICATSSTTPLFPAAWVRARTHVILIGSYKPTMHEIDAELVRRALPSSFPSHLNARACLLVDSRAACLAEAGELIGAGIDGSEVLEIGERVETDEHNKLLLVKRHPSSAEADEELESTVGPITIFKSVGVGLQDVAIACAVVQKADELGIGNRVDWA